MTLQPPSSPDTAPTFIQLRPLNFGDILDQTFRVFRKHFLLLMGIMAVISVPIAVLQGFGLWQYSQGIRQARGDASDPSAILTSALTSSGPLFISTALSTFAGIFQTGALASAISELYLGRTLSIGQAYRGVLRRMGSLLLSTLLIGLVSGVFIAVFVGASVAASFLGPAGAVIYCLMIPLMLVILVFILGLVVYWTFFPQAIVLEGHGAVAGLRRSWNLVRGSFWRVFGITLLIGLMVGIVASIPTFAAQFGVTLIFPKSLEAQTIVNQVIAAIVSILLAPISAIAHTLLYYDLRVRKEGFDLELMARQISAATNADTLASQSL